MFERRRITPFKTTLSAGLLCLASVLQLAAEASAEPLSEAALEGVWYGEPSVNSQPGHIALRIQRDAKGRTIGMLSMLDIDVRDLPIGIVKVDSNRVAIGPMTVEYDAGAETLSGTIPAELAPVHGILFSLKRRSELPLPSAGPPSASAALPRWMFNAGSPVWGGLSHSDGRLFVGTDLGEVIALETKSGRELWRFATDGKVRSRPEPFAKDLFVASDDGYAYRLAAVDGALLWKARLGPPATRSEVGDPSYSYDSYASSPTLSGDTLYIGNGADLVALEAASGKERWRYVTGGAISTRPVIAEALAYVGSFDGKLHAVDARTGKLAWTHDFGAPVTSSPAVSDGLLIVGSRSYDLKALHARSGEVAWRYYFWFSWVESSPSIVDRTAYVGSSDGQKLQAFDTRNGKRSWSLDTGGSAWAKPAVSGGRVYIGSVGVADYLVDHRATFWGVDRKSGSPAWRFDLPRPEGSTLWGFASSPSADDSTVYAAALDGRVYAFVK